MCSLSKLFNGFYPLKKDASLYEVMSRLAESNYPLIDKLCADRKTYAQYGLPAEQRREPPPHALRSYLAVHILEQLFSSAHGGKTVNVADALSVMSRYFVEKNIGCIVVAADTFVKLMSPLPVRDVRRVALLLHVALLHPATRVSVAGGYKFVPLARAELVALRDAVAGYIPGPLEITQHTTF